MADLLPSTSDASAAENADPRVVGVDSDDADDVLAALSSATARQLLAALHDDPATPSKLADAVDTSLQNTQYHLEKLEDAEVVEVVDTVYSEKGREMNVYAPADQPLVLFAGQEEETSSLKTALSRLLGGIGIVGAASIALQQIVGNTPIAPPGTGAGGGGSGGGTGGAVGAADDDGADVSYTNNETDVTLTDAGTTSEDDVGILQEPTEAPESTETVTEYTRTTADAAEETAVATDGGADATTTAVNETVRGANETVAANDSAASALDLGLNGGIPPGLLLFVVGVIAVSVWVFFRHVDRQPGS
ncbi:ArsR/SmtB family transcription factor [Halostella salina]|uniref:ArsR/SmtB family transcription factor n=1 Tax=Halostella salina TaxID=1547897 RepID=UPI000EF84C1E|nr:helix-turn-helix domain-containing protein [Halostella salina]